MCGPGREPGVLAFVPLKPASQSSYFGAALLFSQPKGRVLCPCGSSRWSPPISWEGVEGGHVNL